jgi:hypothetical protein
MSDAARLGRLRSIALAALCVGCAVPAGAVHAQALRERCATQGGVAGTRQLCENGADAALILQPRLGIAFSGGNPVSGTASTMGMRLGTMPRISAGLRITAAGASIPPFERAGATGNTGIGLGSINADASLGVFQGIALMPTVGGVASLDLLGSAGIMPLRGGDFRGSAPASWAVGARLGVLRESFTAPGVSVDVMYRGFGAAAYGDPDPAAAAGHLELERNRAASIRATAGKRVLGFGFTGGVGHDRYRSDVRVRVPDATPSAVVEVSQRGVTTSRTSVYGNASLTLLILNLAAELGWQRGGSAVEGASDRLQRGGLFGGVAARLAI